MFTRIRTLKTNDNHKTLLFSLNERNIFIVSEDKSGKVRCVILEYKYNNNLKKTVNMIAAIIFTKIMSILKFLCYYVISIL